MQEQVSAPTFVIEGSEHDYRIGNFHIWFYAPFTGVFEVMR